VSLTQFSFPGSQCLEIGKDCSGYRTTLTWGVGVASRGKLRGLSLPIANSNPSKSTNGSGETKSQASPTKPFDSSPPKSQDRAQKVKAEDANYANGFGQSTDATSATFAPAASSPTGPIPIPTSNPSAGWHVPGFNEHLEGYSALSGKQDRLHLRPRPLQRLCTSGMVGYEDAVFSAPSTASASTFSDSDFPSPIDFPQSPEEIALAESLFTAYPDRYMHLQDAMQGPETYAFVETPRSFPVTGDYVASSVGSDMSTTGSTELYSPPSDFVGPSSFSEILRPNDFRTIDETTAQIQFGTNSDADHFVDQFAAYLPNHGNEWNITIPRSVDPTGFGHLSPRLQTLLNYYDKAICPVLVAFDGPQNPYRKHILHLAVSNKALQNAIAALSTNNMRMRGHKELNRAGIDPFDHLTADEIRDMHSDPSPEEIHYKSTSVTLFNASLKNAMLATSDSNLATLLVLCLYHVCDSGFSKFKTQLAGVQKLLSMRDRRRGISEFVGWVQMFFTWFDVMTSTVNDRETQVHGDALDMLDLSANLGALEHLAGCEGRLFKLIARLGRLNLLSQNRPVRDPRQLRTPRASPGVKPARDYYSLDGNGWGSPVLNSPSFYPDTGMPTSDPRHEFWTEWHHIRARLAAWAVEVPHQTASPSSSSSSSSSSPVPTDSDTAELQHISESFRHAALLYTERLGSPHLPPSAPQIQAIVSTALSHISKIPVNSCVNKFLLWPVFIAGTECVRPADRDMIRMRCVEITRESGFFNNLSGLEVLERVWAEDDACEGLTFVKGVDGLEVPMLSALGGQAFRWRRAMVKVDGEYIVV